MKGRLKASGAWLKAKEFYLIPMPNKWRDAH